MSMKLKDIYIIPKPSTRFENNHDRGVNSEPKKKEPVTNLYHSAVIIPR